MTKPSLNKAYCCIEVPMDADDKEAFKAWCQENKLTMAQVIRNEIKPLIDRGYLLV
jgi:hypothetical protein